MKDYRWALQKLYEQRGVKSPRNWIFLVAKIENEAGKVKYTEKECYDCFQELKKIILESTMNISHRKLRKEMEKTIKFYEDNYIYEIGSVDSVLDVLIYDTALSKEETIDFLRTAIKL